MAVRASPRPGTRRHCLAAADRATPADAAARRDATRTRRRAAQAATGDPDAKPTCPATITPPAGHRPNLAANRGSGTTRQAGHQARAGVAADTGTGGKPDPDRRDAAPSADWRDEILGAARQPWQPGPSWPDNPALHRPPEADTPGAGIEPGEPHI